MIIDELISAHVPQIEPDQSGSEVLDLMEDAQLPQLPLIDQDIYLSLLRENDLLDWASPDLPVKDSGLLSFRPAVLANSHPLHAWRIAMQHDLEVIPIVDKEDRYAGAVTLTDLKDYVSDNAGFQHPGGVIILQMKRSHYTLSALAQIAESEDVSITSVSMTAPDENGSVEVSLKTNSTDLSALVASLHRHDYDVLHVIGAEGGQDDLMNRYQLLMNYLNM